MYHRYMPTENGQYQRKRVPDARPSPPAPQFREPKPPPKQQPEAHPNEPFPKQPPQPHPKEPSAPASGKQKPQNPPAAPGDPMRIHSSILEKLLPGMDGGDVLVLLILLLLISEGNEDASSVIMTLAIFLFMQ